MYKQTGNSSSKRTSPQRKGNKSVTFTNEKPSQLDGQNDDIELRSKRRDRDNTSQVDGIIDDVDDMDERRPPYHRHDDGKSQEALLVKSNGAALTAEDDRGRRRMSASPKNSPDSSPEDDDFNERFGGNLRPTYSRTSTMRSRSPNRAQAVLKETKRKYTYAAFFLVLSLISFVVQTETAVYIQHELGWDKAYCMLYV